MKYIFLDLDNTLTDRCATIFAYAEAFKINFQNNLKSSIDSKTLGSWLNECDRGGYETHEIRSQRISELDIWVDRVSSVELSSHWQAWVPNNSVPMNGLYECLEALKALDLKLCLVTNGQSRNQREKIQKLGLEGYFNEIIISEEVGFKKPDHEIFNIALTKMGCVSSESLFLGDHPFNDYTASQSLGFLSVWFGRLQEWPTNLPRPKLFIESLLELPKLVISLTNR